MSLTCSTPINAMPINGQYEKFLSSKMQLEGNFGFQAKDLPEFLFDFQRVLVSWSLAKGRSAIWADCGLGKTPMQLVWADQVARKTDGRVLILTPLAVGQQTMRESEKFGIECERSHDGRARSHIVVTNYERLHYFKASDFVGMVCDESSILKNFDGKRKAAITEFMRKMPYRLLCTATAAPNDYTELGTSSEALGYLGHMDMLTRFFRNVDNSTMGSSHGFRFKHKERLQAFRGNGRFWRFKYHAEQPFWRWVCSWARALRRPSDLGFEDGDFILPELQEREIKLRNTDPLPGWLFVKEAIGLREERQETRLTLKQRCECAAELVDHKDPVVLWCNLNDEGKLLARLIPDAVEVCGADSDEKKEESFLAFQSGQIRALICKPKIGAWGLNWQHCAHVIFFVSHSYEQYYQAVRRCWRFGQTRPVRVDIITTGGSEGTMRNMRRKAEQADRMFARLVDYMNDALSLNRSDSFGIIEELPSWL